MEIKDIMNKIDVNTLLSRPLPDWRPTLSDECQVYVFGESYLAKRFDQINYKFCEKNEAKEILVDNLYALLRYKYFPVSTEEVDERINKIVSSFTSNLKTTLKKVSFDPHSDAEVVSMLPDYCTAFRNGVYNFKDKTWLFKYNIIELKRLSNSMYLYDKKYIILWYLDYAFSPLDISITNVDLDKLLASLKKLTKLHRNYCFELVYNIAHDQNNVFSKERFKHICEILGYTILQSFSQHFVVLIGAGQNGKNSLFDGCLTNKLIPRATSNDMNSIENDSFITGALQNKCLNIFLESNPKTYTDSTMLKNLTGSMYQTIHEKGVNKYSGIINCKYVFSANDQDKVKFSDTTAGFRRRINMLEIWYTWDSLKRFLKRGDYYDTTFSDDLSEIKNDVLNTTMYVYLAMYGISIATDNFAKNFKFTENDWNYKYSDVDLDMKDKIESITIQSILTYTGSSKQNYEEFRALFYSIDKRLLYKSVSLNQLGYNDYDGMLKMFSDEAVYTDYFAENDVYISIRGIQSILKIVSSTTSFTQTFKKVYGINSFVMLGANKPYIKCTFINGKLKILK